MMESSAQPNTTAYFHPRQKDEQKNLVDYKKHPKEFGVHSENALT